MRHTFSHKSEQIKKEKYGNGDELFPPYLFASIMKSERTESHEYNQILTLNVYDKKVCTLTSLLDFLTI